MSNTKDDNKKQVPDKKNSSNKLPADIKESFLKSVEKKPQSNKTKKTIKAESVDQKVESNNDSKKDEVKLFDDIEKKESVKTESTSVNIDEKKSEKLKQEKVQKNKTISEKKHKNVKSGKLPFAELVPYGMIAQSVFMLILPFLDNETFFTYIIVTLFWLSVLFSGGIMLYLKIAYRDHIEKTYSEKDRKNKVYRFFSIINFFRNQKAKIADISFFIMFAVFVVMTILAANDVFDNAYFSALVMSLFMLSLNYHVYFNDSIYEYSKKFNKSILAKEVIDNE